MGYSGDGYLVDVAESLGFTVPELRKAVNAKLVLTTHLQLSREERKLINTNHQVKFA